jgi:alpha-tubulin suppressor-like RCC1 family protein
VAVSSGHVDCWGQNGAGQLGDGTTTSSDMPVEVQGVTNAIEVSAGESDSCAVLSSGHLDCWGDNSDGALGDGSHGSFSDKPVEVQGVTNAIHVAVGSRHACAVLSNGNVDCWGIESIDAIGYPRYTPVEVLGITDAIEVSAGDGDSCALLSSGRVECWEENHDGQLGDGSTEASEIPVEVRGVTTATQIAEGRHYSCALLSSGHISCWGNNESGQLGNGTTGGSDIAVEVLGVTNATQLAAGGSDSCALMSNSHIDCWGDNFYGQLGDGAIDSSDTPVEVHDATNAAQVAAGGNHSCALLSGGRIDCWGNNEGGELGNGINGGNRDTPGGVQGLTRAIQVAVDYAHSCALLSSGHVECWGENFYGQLGDGTTERSETPVEVRGLTNAVQIDGGDFDSCALLSSGHVDCWGGGPFASGQLGDGAKQSSATPVEVRDLPNATQVATSDGGSCALLSSGHIDCWGNNEEGELGDGTHGGQSDMPVEVPGVTNATEVASGGYHFCALLSGGHVDCWGSNSGGQLGDGTDLASDTPVEVHGLTNAAQIAATYKRSCAVLSSGHIDCWGDNLNGQLGDGTTTGPEYCAESEGPCSKTPVEVQALTSAAHVAVGGSDSCALVSSGHVDCWGGNLSGQLGDGTAAGPEECGEYYACDYWDTPVEVQGLNDAIQTGAASGDSAAQGTACAVLSNGQLDCWGSNNNGALGNGLAWSTLPVGVVGFSLAVDTGGSSVVGETSASVGGSVNPEGASVLSCAFEYGPSTSYGQSAPCSQAPGDGNTAVPVSAQITSLAPGTRYHYRLLAANSGGTSYGGDETFTTLLETSTQAPVPSANVSGTTSPPYIKAPEGASIQSAGVTSTTAPYTSLLSLSATPTKKGKLSLTMSCHGASTCTGIVSITIIKHVKHHGSKTVLLASAPYTLSAPSSAKITLILSSHVRALLAESGTLHTAATITTTGGATLTPHTSRLTIHAAKR